MMSQGKRIGLIAGNGRFPRLFAQAASRVGHRVVAVALEGETDPDLEQAVEDLVWVKPGQLERLITSFKERGISEVAMAGGVRKERMFKDADPDLRAMKLLARIVLKRDDSILRAVADELEKDGILVRPSTDFLQDLLAPKSVLSARTPTPAESADIDFGWSVAKDLGRLDIGQCVVVKAGTILALEAIEGSDETIRRGGKIGRGGAVVVKVSKPRQDLRFDLPSVGPTTIDVMAESGASVLAVEAGTSLIFDREDFVRKADAAGIAVIGR